MSTGLISQEQLQGNADAIRQQSSSAPVTNEFRTIICASEFLDVVIDEVRMYVSPLPVTNGSEDREGDRVNPDGLIVATYVKNPVVYWQHSHQTDPLVPPIGTANTPDRRFDMYRDGDSWLSGCLFSQKSALSNQIFSLICEGVVRTRSIGAIALDVEPIVPSIPLVAVHEGRVICTNPVSSYFHQSELVEWSWTGIPCHRDMTIAMKSIMSRGRVDGQRIDKFLLKTLKALDLREPVQVSRESKFGGRKLVAGITGTIVGVGFAKGMQVGAARRFLQETGVLHADSLTVAKDGSVFAKQLDYRGSMVLQTDPKCPGIKFFVVKSAGMTGETYKMNGTEAVRRAMDEGDNADGQGRVNSGSEGQEGASGKTAPDKASPKKSPEGGGEGGDGGGKPQASKNELVEQAKALLGGVAPQDEDAPLSGPAGSQHLQAMSRAIKKLMKDSEASELDVEHPDVSKLSGEMKELMTMALKRLNESHDSIFGEHPGVTVKMCSDCEEEQDEKSDDPDGDESPQDAHIAKAMRAAAFRGHARPVSTRFLKGFAGFIKSLDRMPVVASVGDSVGEDDPEERMMLLKQLDHINLLKKASFLGMGDR